METQSKSEDLIDEPLVGEIASHPLMSKEKPHMLVAEINREVEYYTPYTGEKGLLAAVLERAVRDLGYAVTKQERKAAIEWFEAPEEETESGFSYAEVSEGLNLTKWHHDFIMQKVKEAHKLQEAWRKKKADQLKINLENRHNVRLFSRD